MDADHNGSIDKAELRSAFAAAGVELTMKEVKAMMAEADEDGDGFLDAQEFEAVRASISGETQPS